MQIVFRRMRRRWPAMCSRLWQRVTDSGRNWIAVGRSYQCRSPGLSAASRVALKLSISPFPCRRTVFRRPTARHATFSDPIIAIQRRLWADTRILVSVFSCLLNVECSLHQLACATLASTPSIAASTCHDSALAAHYTRPVAFSSPCHTKSFSVFILQRPVLSRSPASIGSLWSQAILCPPSWGRSPGQPSSWNYCRGIWQPDEKIIK